MRIDIATTATLRPELLVKTFRSFWRNLFGYSRHSFYLYINVDPVGFTEDKIDTEYRFLDIEDICRNYFGDRYTMFTPQEAHFPSAVRRCWTMPTGFARFVFNLEEDWELQYPLDFDTMVEVMGHNPDVAHLRLSIFKSTQESCKNWSKFFIWNGEFFECPIAERGGIGWCGHPSLNRVELIQDAVKNIDFTKNPEKQMKAHYNWFKKWSTNYRFGSFQPQNSPASIKDIGREWMIKNKWKKKEKNKEWFTTWKRSE